MRKLKHILLALFFVLFLISNIQYPISSLAFASEYTLPYPSYMPGHKLYRLEQIWDSLQRYWHFGEIAKFKYHMGISDKKLVEAKTLFEYKQYLLAVEALEESDKNYKQAGRYLKNAQVHGKAVNKQEVLFSAAGQKHVQVLEELQKNLPEDFIWQEEKKKPIQIDIYKRLQRSIVKR